MVVWQNLLRKRFTLKYFNPLELFFLEPDRAAQSGGALIRVRGRGFTAETQFYIGNQLASIARFVTSEELWLEAPAQPLYFGRRHRSRRFTGSLFTRKLHLL